MVGGPHDCFILGWHNVDIDVYFFVWRACGRLSIWALIGRIEFVLNTPALRHGRVDAMGFGR